MSPSARSNMNGHLGRAASTVDPRGSLECGAKVPEGWLARLELELDVRAGRTILKRKHQFGPLTVQRPFYPEGNVCHLYLLHPPGGVVGGDRLEIELIVASGAHALVTTPGAAKFYRSAGKAEIAQQRLKVAEGGCSSGSPRRISCFQGRNCAPKTPSNFAVMRGSSDGRCTAWDGQWSASVSTQARQILCSACAETAGPY